jgi:hypothetical protein
VLVYDGRTETHHRRIAGRAMLTAFMRPSCDRSVLIGAELLGHAELQAVSALPEAGDDSVGTSCHAALLEVFNCTIKLNPIMFRLLKNGSDGGGIFWICQRADGNADQRW